VTDSSRAQARGPAGLRRGVPSAVILSLGTGSHTGNLNTGMNLKNIIIPSLPVATGINNALPVLCFPRIQTHGETCQCQ
jgi:hypothetical protein